METTEKQEVEEERGSAKIPMKRLVMRINSSNLKATIGDVEYQWEGGFGTVLSSIEKNVKEKEVRMVGDQLMYAWKIENRRFKKPIVHWSFPDIDAEQLRLFKRAIFGA